MILCGQILNPKYVNKVDMKRLVSIGIVDFTGYDDLYLSLKNEIEKDEKKAKYVTFDKDSRMVWINWYY